MRKMSTKKAPIINFQLLDSAQELQKLIAACEDYGYFYLKNHNIEQGLLKNFENQMHQFFSLTEQEKKQIERSAENPWGFFDRELTKQQRDWKEILDIGPVADDDIFSSAKTQWPDSLPEFRDVVTEYISRCEQIAIQLLAGLAAALEVEADHLHKAFENHTSFLRLNFYPRCHDPADITGLDLPSKGHLGINYHTDSGALTLLLLDEQPGLEVYLEDEWHGVDPEPGTLLVNLGDLFQVWSNDRFKAPLHRVRANKNKERYSAPYFYNPGYHADISPQVPVNEQLYSPINWGEFRSRRAEGDYASYGEEVQISNYKK